MKSVRGIYYDLKETEYKFNIDNLTFYFSSNVYLEKFKLKYEEYLYNETLKLEINFKCDIDAKIMILLKLYKIIEKRGFKVLYDGIDIQDNYILKINLF